MSKSPFSRGQFSKVAVSRGRVKDVWQPCPTSTVLSYILVVLDLDLGASRHMKYCICSMIQAQFDHEVFDFDVPFI